MEVKDNEVIGLKHIIVYYLHSWKLFAVAFVISLIGAGLYLALYPKTYEMMATIQVQDESDFMSSGSMGLGEAAGLMKSFGLGGANVAGINMDDELMVLMSNELVKKMVLDLGVNVDYSEPYSFDYKLYNESPLALVADSMIMDQLAEVIVLDISVDKNKIKVYTKVGKDKQSFTYTSLPAIIKLKQGDFTLDYKKKGTSDEIASFDLKIKVSPARWVAEELVEGFLIEESSKTSNVIELSCRDYEKQRGVDMLNTLIKLYNERAKGVKMEESSKAQTFLDERINNVTRELLSVELNIEEYKTKNRLTNLEYDVQFYADQMKELQSKMIEMQTQSQVLDMMYAYVKNPENKYNLVPALLSVQEGEKGSAISTYNEALIERSRILKNSSPDNPLISSLNSQVEQLRKSVFLTIQNAKESIDMTMKDLKAKERLIYDKMGNVPLQERVYLDYKRQQEILQGVYLILLQKREEIALATGQDKQKARVIDLAYVKKMPVAPRKLFAAIGMFLFTLLLPMGYLFCKEQLIALIKTYKENKA